MISNKRNANTRKRRTARRKTRRYRGGDMFNAEQLIRQMSLHEDMERMGKRKPVATPYSTNPKFKGSFKYFRNLYDKVKGENDNNILQDYAHRNYGFTLGVWVKEQDPEMEKHINEYGHYHGNPLIFYSVEHLEALALASGLDLDKILLILARASNLSDPLDHAIINIAFGDSFPPLNYPLNEIGRNIFEVYNEIAKERYFNAAGRPMP